MLGLSLKTQNRPESKTDTIVEHCTVSWFSSDKLWKPKGVFMSKIYWTNKLISQVICGNVEVTTDLT